MHTVLDEIFNLTRRDISISCWTLTRLSVNSCCGKVTGMTLEWSGWQSECRMRMNADVEDRLKSVTENFILLTRKFLWNSVKISSKIIQNVSITMQLLKVSRRSFNQLISPGPRLGWVLQRRTVWRLLVRHVLQVGWPYCRKTNSVKPLSDDLERLLDNHCCSRGPILTARNTSP